MEMVFGIPSSSIATLRGCMLRTLYGPEARCSTLLYRQFAISLTASDVVTVSWG